ncbi:CAP domain-containing protein [Hoeflea sp. WL0058]|uniref:CAP domain-containing protein n=1 Tax=Flavimaribacter sediminis TaxID=2865987 RepID=A0AAE2ZTN6_9HYPH|nr:CAP domain-containing protein [Flavimaribacter sediminis]MBW8640665.1 CAP domain-containing protein [Flavimaribacter sediminis]
MSRNRISALLVLLAVFMTSPVSMVGAADLEVLRERALALVNEAREKQELTVLQRSTLLDKAAQSHAEDMMERDYYSHSSPEGDTVSDRFRDRGGSRWKLVAENIATCSGCDTPPTVDRVVAFQKGWMDSPGHRENILKAGLDSFGFGIAGSDGRIFAVQTFAGAGEPRGLGPGEEAVALAPGEQLQQAERSVNRARQRADVETVEASEALADVARQLLPEGDLGKSLIDRPDNLFDLLPHGQAEDWSSLSIMAGACGGCGSRPTAADIRYFVGQWSDDPQDGRTVLDEGATHLGFAMRVDGDGRKIAVAVLGQKFR